MKILKISTLMLALAVAPFMDAIAANHSLHKAEAKVSEVMSDAMITAKIKELYLEDPELSSLKIHVKTKNQIVTLTGKVSSKEERDIAINWAKSINDVKYVQSKLKIVAES